MDNGSKLEIKNVSKYYDGKPVIEDINLAIPAGKMHALLGPSGVGKTTLFNIIAGLDEADEGDILLSGFSIKNESGKVSYMLQKDLLLPYMSIEDNVALPLVIQKIPKTEARSRVSGYFELFGLDGCQKKYPKQLSGGMRQRAALLRTYMFGRDVSLLDEPFSALDTMTKHKMHIWYLDILAKLDLTTLFITHDIDEALYLADKVIVLNGVPGRVTLELELDRGSFSRDEFILSPSFLDYKRKILDILS